MSTPSDRSEDLQSPLRYPGGKRFLCPYIEAIIRRNKLKPRLLVEPFAGGASVALHLLGLGLVEKIALYDADPMVVGLWQTVFHDGKWLRRKVRGAKITLDLWEQLKDAPLDGNRNNAWKCLFLNRTSFSGILSQQAGPIGGKLQQSDYKIDCRFYRDTTIKRLKRLAAHKYLVEDIGVATWQATLKKFAVNKGTEKSDTLIYLDPPFYHKADRLYGHYFLSGQHEELIKRLAKSHQPWILSYDNCTEIVSLFRKYGLRYRSVPVSYTSSVGCKRESKKELVASNLSLPKA